MSYHRNFTAGYDTRGTTDPLHPRATLNRPDYPWNAQYGTDRAPFVKRYYDRPEGAPRGTWRDPVAPDFNHNHRYGEWDPYAVADPAYFYGAYGTPYDPMYTSRDGIQAPYWGMEYAEIPETRMRYLANWIGKRFWRKERKERPNLEDVPAPIYETDLPTPYLIISGERGRMSLANRLVQIPRGALLVYLKPASFSHVTGQVEEYIENVSVRPSATFGI